MSPNIPFLVARRRNEIKKHGEAFLERLAKKIGLALPQVKLVEAAHSLDVERAIYLTLSHGIRSGVVQRHAHLDQTGVAALFRRALLALRAQKVLVLFANFKDFTVECDPDALANKLDALIEFDGDTITVASEHLSEGIACDVETEASDQRLYELDVWGSALQSALVTS